MTESTAPAEPETSVAAEPTDGLLGEIMAFCERTGMSGKTFGRKAVNNTKLVERLEDGGYVAPKTARKVRAFISVAGIGEDQNGRPPPPTNDTAVRV